MNRNAALATPPATLHGPSPEAAVGTMREGIGEEILRSRHLKTFDGVEVARYQFMAGVQMEDWVPEGHLLTLHLSEANAFASRFDGRVEEAVGRRGDISIFPAGTTVGGFIGGASGDVNVHLDEGFFRRVAETAGADPNDLEVLHRFCERDPQVEQLMLSFLSEVDSGGIGGELYTESLANALAVHLLREHSSIGYETKRKVRREPKGSLSRRQIKAALDYVGDNLAGDLSLADLASVANLSERHLLRLFGEATGLSPHQYVLRMRVEKAGELLANTELSVGEVAERCGFSHHQHLNRHFRSQIGVSPTRFRKEARR